MDEGHRIVCPFVGGVRGYRDCGGVVVVPQEPQDWVQRVSVEIAPLYEGLLMDGIDLIRL